MLSKNIFDKKNHVVEKRLVMAGLFLNKYK